jgi:hypothetical protein
VKISDFFDFTSKILHPQSPLRVNTVPPVSWACDFVWFHDFFFLQFGDWGGVPSILPAVSRMRFHLANDQHQNIHVLTTPYLYKYRVGQKIVDFSLLPRVGLNARTPRGVEEYSSSRFRRRRLEEVNAQDSSLSTGICSFWREATRPNNIHQFPGVLQAYKKEGPKFIQRLVAKQKARVKDS